jgi:flagellar assembly factor FliW
MTPHQHATTAEATSQILFEEGIIGVPRARRFELLERPGSALRLLRSLDIAGFALPVVDPRVAEPGYRPSFQPRVAEALSLGEDSCLVLVVVTLGEDRSTANLRAPIVINVARRVGAQIILDDRSLPLERELAREL